MPSKMMKEPKNIYIMTSAVKSFVLFVFIAMPHLLSAQSEQLVTQYMFNEVVINPAYSGSRDCLAATFNLRDQWRGIEGAPTTGSFAIHSPVGSRSIGIGLSGYGESIGLMKENSVYFNAAYRLKMKNGYTCFGLRAGYSSMHERVADYVVIDEGDNYFEGSNSQSGINFGTGFYTLFPKWFVGFSIPKLIYNGAPKIKNWHYYITAGYAKSLSPTLLLKPMVLIKAVSGAPIQADFTATLLMRKKVWMGGAWRTGDAGSVLIGAYATPQLRVGYSYDFALHALKNSTSGSHEISIGYDLNYKKDNVYTNRYF
jgi:type IX secretion system PorP/SprF family membrane protein